MRGWRVVLAMLVGACIGASVIVVGFRHRFGWPASAPSVVVPLCLVIAIAAIWKWWRLSVDISAEVERAIERLSRSNRFEASIRKSFAIGIGAGTLMLVALVLAPTHAPHTAGRLGLAFVALMLIACGWVIWGWALKPGATLVMDTRGLQYAPFGRIPWEAIVGMAYKETTFGNDPDFIFRSLRLAIAAPHRFAHQFSPALRFLQPSLTSPSTRFDEISFSLEVLDEPYEVIVAAAYEFRGRVDAPFAVGWESGMTSRELAALLALDTASSSDASSERT